MLRITALTVTPEEAALRLEGAVADEEVAVLAAEGQTWLRTSRRLVLDLYGVRFVDTAGLALLQGWAGPRLVLRGASPFLQSVLRAEGLVPE